MRLTIMVSKLFPTFSHPFLAGAVARVSPPQMVVVSEIRGQRAHLIAPFNGWASLSTEEGYEIIQPTKRSTRYRVGTTVVW